MLEIWKCRSKLNLLGSDINTKTGEWTNPISWTGLSSDSYYEYLLKGAIVFGDEELYDIFNKSYTSINMYLKHGPYHFETTINDGNTIRYRVASVQAFWPSIEVLLGHINLAEYYYNAYYEIWNKYNSFPETYDIRQGVYFNLFLDNTI